MRPLIGIPAATNLRKTGTTRFVVSRSYCRALELAGAAPVLIPLLDDEEALLEICARLDGLLLSGGGDVAPRRFGEAPTARLSKADLPRDRTELLLIRSALTDGLPLLAICRGVQMLNVALGGTLYQDIEAQVPGALRHRSSAEFPRNYLAHGVQVEDGTRLASIVGAGDVPVNSLHHQAVRDVAPALRVVAAAPDGVIEALEGRDGRFVLGVQWHPEELVQDDPRMLRLFTAFVSAAA